MKAGTCISAFRLPEIGTWPPHDELVDLVGEDHEVVENKILARGRAYTPVTARLRYCSINYAHSSFPEASEPAVAPPSTIVPPPPTRESTGAREAKANSTDVEPHKVKHLTYVAIDRRWLYEGWHLDISVSGMRYLIPHDELVEIVRNTANWLNTRSWLEGGRYSTTRPSRVLIARLQKYAIT